MDSEKKYPLAYAKKIAESLVELFTPYCYRVEIAGSIRREKPEVKDIEIVCIPKPYMIGLFEDGMAEIVNSWEKVKGEMEYGVCKYTQRILPEGIKLDLFFAEEIYWGLILAIRTGSAEYSHKVLANTWVAKGYKSENGLLMNGERVCPVREEKDLFMRLSIPYTEPKYRNV